MESRYITLKAPHPSPPPQGGREFQAHYCYGNAITTQTASARNDNTAVALRGGFSVGRRVNEAKLKNFKT